MDPKVQSSSPPDTDTEDTEATSPKPSSDAACRNYRPGNPSAEDSAPRNDCSCSHSERNESDHVSSWDRRRYSDEYSHGMHTWRTKDEESYSVSDRQQANLTSEDKDRDCYRVFRYNRDEESGYGRSPSEGTGYREESRGRVEETLCEDTEVKVQESRLVCLPEDVLGSILSRLDTAAAVRTSILCKGTRSSWKSASVLHLSLRAMPPLKWLKSLVGLKMIRKFSMEVTGNTLEHYLHITRHIDASYLREITLDCQGLPHRKLEPKGSHGDFITRLSLSGVLFVGYRPTLFSSLDVLKHLKLRGCSSQREFSIEAPQLLELDLDCAREMRLYRVSAPLLRTFRLEGNMPELEYIYMTLPAVETASIYLTVGVNNRVLYLRSLQRILESLHSVKSIDLSLSMVSFKQVADFSMESDILYDYLPGWIKSGKVGGRLLRCLRLHSRWFNYTTVFQQGEDGEWSEERESESSFKDGMKLLTDSFFFWIREQRASKP